MTERRHGKRQQDRRRASISPARLVAYDVLRDVDERDAYANLALSAKISAARLTGRDAGLAVELAAGTLRGRGRYDRIIELAATRATSEIDPQTLNVLRLGAHQLLSTRVPHHAALNETVELQRRVANPRAVGFVNGVLRTISRSTPQSWDERIAEAAEHPDHALAETQSHPVWIVRAFRDALAAEGRAAELEELLTANNTAPKVNLVVFEPAENAVRDLAAETDEIRIEKRGISPIGWELSGGDPYAAITRLGVPEGSVRVQDQGSQLAALALTNAPLTRSRSVESGTSATPERWMDLCAGPGGKTAVLGVEARAHGATVRANEVSEHRAELVRASTEFSRDRVSVFCEDGRSPEAFDGAQEMYDRILVDAPCSGIGALRRRPEARWRKSPSDLPELTALQFALLDRAVRQLAPGGVVAYVTCSPHLAETRVIVDRVLKQHPDLAEQDAKHVLSQIVTEPLDLGSSDSLSVQLWPHRHGTDAMFIALLHRPLDHEKASDKAE